MGFSLRLTRWRTASVEVVDHVHNVRYVDDSISVGIAARDLEVFNGDVVVAR